MLNKYLIKFAAIGALITAVITVNPVKANAAWERGEEPYDPSVTSWRYKDGSSYVQNDWKNINLLQIPPMLDNRIES